MTDWVIALVPTYGLWLLAVVTFLACLALPVPCPILMLTAGGFAAAGDLILWQLIASALGGAVVGDQTSYQIGVWGGHPLLQRLSATPAREKLVLRALQQMEARGRLASSSPAGCLPLSAPGPTLPLAPWPIPGPPSRCGEFWGQPSGSACTAALAMGSRATFRPQTTWQDRFLASLPGWPPCWRSAGG